MCVLKNLIFLTSKALKIFWGPQKRPNFWILDLWVCLKKLGLGPTVLNFLSCIYWSTILITSFFRNFQDIGRVTGQTRIFGHPIRRFEDKDKVRIDYSHILCSYNTKFLFVFLFYLLEMTNLIFFYLTMFGTTCTYHVFNICFVCLLIDHATRVTRFSGDCRIIFAMHSISNPIIVSSE